MKRLILSSMLLCAAAARAEIKERIAAVVNGQPILLSDVEERVGPELTKLMQQAPGAERDKDRAGLLHRGLTGVGDEKLIEYVASSLGLAVAVDVMERKREYVGCESV